MQILEYRALQLNHRYQLEVAIPALGGSVRTTWFPTCDMATGMITIGDYLEVRPTSDAPWQRLDRAKPAHAGLFDALQGEPAYLAHRLDGIAVMREWLAGGVEWPSPAQEPEAVAEPEPAQEHPHLDLVQ